MSTVCTGDSVVFGKRADVGEGDGAVDVVVLVGLVVVTVGAGVGTGVGAAVVVVATGAGGAAVVVVVRTGVVGAGVVVVVGTGVDGAVVVVVGTESAKPGCEISDVRAGTAPGVHTQSGSPSSIPFVNPSPSESSRQNVVDHVRPFAAKSTPNEFRS